MGVVDVVPGAVGEHGVDQHGLDLGCDPFVEREAAGIVGGLFVLEVPTDPTPLTIGGGDVGVDEHRGGGDRIVVAPAHDDAVLGLDPADLGQRHDLNLAECLPDEMSRSRRLATRSARPPRIVRGNRESESVVEVTHVVPVALVDLVAGV